MNQILTRMAKQASSDASLMASFIRRYGEREGLSWEEIAKELRIESLQLAKLALCRTPGQTSFSDDIDQIVDYVGVNRSVLMRFLGQREAAPASLGLGARWGAFVEGLGLMFKRPAWAFGIAALILLIVGAVAFAQPRRSDATLVVAKGSATITEAGTTVLALGREELTVAAGEIASVSAGDTIALGPGSSAQLRLYDGSTVDISENTTLEVANLYTTDDTYRVSLHMLTGKTVSRVIRVLGAGDTFRVSTPSSTASVRGTIFTVEVIDPDTTHIACDEGVVAVAMGNQDVDVEAGSELTAVVGATMEVKPQVDFVPPEGQPSDRPVGQPAEGPPDTPPVAPPGQPSDRPVGPPDDESDEDTGLPASDASPPGITEEDRRPDTPPGLEDRTDDDLPPGQENRPTNEELPPISGIPPGHSRRHNPNPSSEDEDSQTPGQGNKNGWLKASGPPPGLTGDAPGRSGEAPGQTGEHPQGGPPGQTGEAPGQSGDAPGQTDEHPQGGAPGQIKKDNP